MDNVKEEARLLIEFRYYIENMIDQLNKMDRSKPWSQYVIEAQILNYQNTLREINDFLESKADRELELKEK